MKVELITGSTLLESVKNTFKSIDVKDIDTDYFIVVPDRFTLKAEDILFETLNLTSVFNINIMSLTGLAKEILGKENIETINILEGVMLIQKAINNLENELVFYKKSSPMFCYELLKNINQIKSCMIAPEELLYEGDKEILKKKIHDISLIYKEYQSLIEGKKDSSDLICECIENIKEKKGFKDKVIVFAGFDSFTELNYQLIKSCMSGCKKLMISLATPNNLGNQYIYENDILEKIKKLANEDNVEIEVKSFKKTLNKNQTILVENLFSQSPKVVKDGYLKVISASNLREEVEFMANLIKYRVYKGDRYKDFNIACASLANYEGIIEKVFEERKIPYYIDSEVNMKNSCLVRYIMTIFDLKKKNFLNEDLLYIANSFLINIEEREDFISFINERNINGRKGFNNYIKDKIPLIDEYVKELDKAIYLKDYVFLVRKIILDTKDNFDKYLLKLEDMGLLKERSIEEQVPEFIEKIIKILDKEEKSGFDNFYDLFNLGVANCNLSSLPAFCDSVFVGDMTNSYFGENSNMIVLGANRGKMPIAMADNGLMSDTDISDAGLIKNINPTVKMINRRNRFKMFSNLSLAKENLYISFVTADEEGKSTDKAMFVDMLIKIFNVKGIINTSEFTYFLDDKDFERYLFSLGGNRSTAELKLLEDLKNGEIPSSFVGSLQKVLKYDFERMKLNKEKIEEPLLQEDTFSVSRIERYYDCPFRHFVDYSLKLKEKFSIDIQKNDKGSFYHSILENFVRRYGKELKKVSYEEIVNFVEENIENLMDFKQLEFLPDREIIKKELKKDSIELCKRVVEESMHSRFKPSKQEYSIVKKYKVNGSEIVLKGKVDRLDEIEGEKGKEFRIIDYKTGNISKNLYTELYYGKKVQLFLYSKSLREILGQAPLGLYYFNAKPGYVTKETPILEGVTLEGEITKIDNRLNDPSYSESKIIKAVRKKDTLEFNKITEENLKKLEKYAFNISEKALQQMAEGNIKSSPTENSCEYCKYRGICLYNINEGFRITKSKRQEDLLKEGNTNE